ncbi:MAG: hypothetical protein ACE5H8_11680 [Alphaproteobacteria bacterium]
MAPFAGSRPIANYALTALETTDPAARETYLRRTRAEIAATAAAAGLSPSEADEFAAALMDLTRFVIGRIEDGGASNVLTRVEVASPPTILATPRFGRG